MSIRRINHTQNEVKKLSSVVDNLIASYDTNFKKHDLEYERVRDDFDKKKTAAQDNNDMELFGNIIEKEMKFTIPLDNLKTFAQFQNELILVKHYALIESMIINIFRHLTKILQHSDLHDTYFIQKNNFSDSLLSANKIAEITNKEILLKKKKFWHAYDTMGTIRHTIAHGDPLFIMSYRRVKEFNSIINIIYPYSEKNEGSLQDRFPSLLHPTYTKKSKWYCHLSSKINELRTLNENALSFVNEIRCDYVEFGKKNNFSEHVL